MNMVKENVRQNGTIININMNKLLAWCNAGTNHDYFVVVVVLFALFIVYRYHFTANAPYFSVFHDQYSKFQVQAYYCYALAPLLHYILSCLLN